MEWLNNISPQAIGIVAVIIILREVFAFIKTRKIEDTADRVMIHDAALIDTLKRINTNIEALTDLMREICGQMKDLRRDVDGMRRDVDDLSDDIKRSKL